MSMPNKLSGKVASGLGKGALFTELDWAKKQFISELGIDTYPGTLNLQLDDNGATALWHELRAGPSYTIHAEKNEDCNANCYPVYIQNRYPGAVVLPLFEDYPLNQVEIIAAVPLRESLSLQDGDALELEFVHPLRHSTIIFDLDGTLLDTIEAFYMLARQTGDEFGIEMKRSHVYNLLNHGKSYWESALPDDMPNRQSRIEELNKRAHKLWPAIMSKHARVFPNVEQTLHQLKNRGTKLGIVTGSGKSTVDLLFSVGVEGFFDAIVNGEDISKRKPDPEGLLKCLQILNVEPDDALYVGDTAIDVQASTAAGICSVAVLSGAGGAKSLAEAGACRIISDHSALIGLLE